METILRDGVFRDSRLEKNLLGRVGAGLLTGRDHEEQEKTAGRIPAVGQEPQEFSVRLPRLFYRAIDGLAN